MARSDKVQSAVEQTEHIDLPLQNGGTKPQEENPDPSKQYRNFTGQNLVLSISETGKKKNHFLPNVSSNFKLIMVMRVQGAGRERERERGTNRQKHEQSNFSRLYGFDPSSRSKAHCMRIETIAGFNIENAESIHARRAFRLTIITITNFQAGQESSGVDHPRIANSNLFPRPTLQRFAAITKRIEYEEGKGVNT